MAVTHARTHARPPAELIHFHPASRSVFRSVRIRHEAAPGSSSRSHVTGGKAWEPWVLQVHGCCRSMRHPDSGDRTESQLSKLRPQDPGPPGAEGGFLPAAARLRVPFSEALGSQPLQVRGGAECPRPWFPFCRVLSSTRLPLARCCPALQSAWACTAVCACHRPSTGRGRGDEPHPAAGVTARSCCCRRPSATTLGGTPGP